MPMHIHPFTPDQYGTIAAIREAAMPKDPSTAERIRDWDENRPRHLEARRWVAELDGTIVGVGEYTQSSDLYHPRKFQTIVYVHPLHRRRGIGSALYDRVCRELERFAPIAYQGRAYEDEEAGLAFLHKRGFREDFRTWESHLDVAAFDPMPWARLEERLRDRGIHILSLAELSDDLRRDREIFDLERDTVRDIPSPESITAHRADLSPEEVEEQFARYVQRVLNAPDRYPAEAYFLAVTGDRYVGLSYNFADREHGLLDVEMTGVRREYRGQGIATVLKLRGAAYARDHGYRTIRTWNDTVNRPILAINEKMGFARQPALLFFEKDLRRSEECG